MADSSNPSDQPPDRSFEDSLLALQQIVSDLEGGTITLDESLQRFEAGIGLLRQCYQFLDKAEQRIEQLVSLDAQGNCTLVPFDATATVDKQTKPPAKATVRKPAKTKEAEPAPPPVEPPSLEADSLDIPGKLLF